MTEQDWIALGDLLRKVAQEYAATGKERRRNVLAALDAVDRSDAADVLMDMLYE